VKKINKEVLRQSIFERMFPSEKAFRSVNNTNTTRDLALINQKNISRPSSPEELSVTPSINPNSTQLTPTPMNSVKGGKRKGSKSRKNKRSSRKVRKTRRA
jgi:hypothetical protein